MSVDGTIARGKDPDLVGREPARARIRQLLAATLDGHSAVLVVRAAAGLGKTALLEDVATAATEHRVVRVRGTAAETDLPYAALHLLCSALPVELGELDGHQREALEIVVGLRGGPAPDRFLVCVAVLELLVRAAHKRPVLCVVDDAQWLDDESAYVLGFVARRVGPVPIAVLFADRGNLFAELPELVLEGLNHADAYQLVRSVLPIALDEAVLERLVVESRGNPRVLRESVLGVSPVELAGGYRPPSSIGLEMLDGLTPESRSLLTLASAEPLGDPVRLWRAAAGLGIRARAAQQLEAANLVSFGAWVSFRDPGLRGTVYWHTCVEERRRAHAALAAATDPVTEPDRRVWHLAHSQIAPDDAVADELMAAIDRSRARGGLPAAAAFLEQAAICTADPSLRVERAVLAAETYHAAGAVDDAVRLLAIIELGSPGDLAQARAERVRARMAFDASRRRPAVGQLLTAAERIDAAGNAPATSAYLEALGAAVFTGCADLTRAIVTSPAVHEAGDDRLLAAVAERCTAGYAAAVEPLKLAVKTLDCDDWDGARSRLLACLVAPDLWDDAGWHRLTSAELVHARSAGAQTLLPYALTQRALVEIQSGWLTEAQALVDEAKSLADNAGTPPFSYARSLLEAWRGHSSEATAPREGVAAAVERYAAAVLNNGLGSYQEAVASTRPALEGDTLELQGWSLAELVEAAVRSGDQRLAMEAAERLSDRTRLCRTEWAMGVEAQCLALVRDGAAAEDLYVEAIAQLGRCRVKTQLARAQLLYGEWLRRQGRRCDAREPLRAAQASFRAMDAGAFAQRAERELLATGERARPRGPEHAYRLTPQEARIASLARDGRSNPEIATTLSISPRTVEYHLHKVYIKLSVTSRNELHLALADVTGDQADAVPR
ncbi:AAA family ATPase [Kribbella sp. NPDC048928]|uniref:helix-turn-helix transcriptional regulator n=1 Tax=Kribbella sp. NPDC048928 TaxID=3364111 RepID=UPI00371A6225